MVKSKKKMKRTIKAAIIGAVITGMFGILTVVINHWLSKKDKQNGPPSLVDSKIEMIPIPAGYFLMGSSEEEIEILVNDYKLGDREFFEDETPQRRVYLDSFYISKYEIKNEQYEKFLKDNPDYEIPPYWNKENYNHKNQPVVGISWYDALAYCNWLSEKTQKKYRLPTEAEWERSARGTDGQIFPWGNSLPDIQKANFMNQHNQPLSVKEKPGGISSTGTMNMAGNVWEWCYDWYDENCYKSSLQAKNPINTSEGNEKVVRGGSWNYNAFYLRCAARFKFPPDVKRRDLGFRIVRLPNN